MIPAVYAERLALARRTGEAVMAMLSRGGPLPRELVTRKSLENACAAVSATGGSTNAALHLPAIAHEAGTRKLRPPPTLPPPGDRIIFRGMILPRVPALTRLRVKPDEPAEGSTVAGPPAVQASDRPKGTRRPHPDSSVRAVRHLVETTTLTFAQIQARTGVNHSTITLWKRNHGWTRPATRTT